MTSEFINVAPDPARIVEGLRDTGYNFNTAIADIVDNSIAAGATTVEIGLQLDQATKQPYIYIADNGEGINRSELINAMRYGSKERDNKSSLGKFGLGLKTASTAFCRCLSVISRKDDNVVRKVQWDLDYISEHSDWRLKEPDVTEDELEILNETTEEKSGTLVVWDKVDRLLKNYTTQNRAKKALENYRKQLAFHLSMVFQRFLDFTDERADNIIIKLNGEKIDPWDPFCSSEGDRCESFPKTIKAATDDEDKRYLSMNAVILPRKDSFSTKEAANEAKISSDLQGFYIYRENRLIHFADWLGIVKKEPHLSLLRVEISFDHSLDDLLNVDIKKSRIIFNDEIKNQITNFLNVPRRFADDRYRRGTNIKSSDQSKGVHDASNRNIDEKAGKIENSRVTVTNPKTGDIKIENSRGSFNSKIKIQETENTKQCRVVTESTLEGNCLWEPTMIEGKVGVCINSSHPYYQKIYLPNKDSDVLVTGMDSLLWAMCQTEMDIYNDEAHEMLLDFRNMVSRKLKKLVSDLPDPKIGEDSD